MLPISYAMTTAMRTTLNIDDDLFEQASELTGVTEKTALVRQSLRALIERETSRRLAKLGGKDATAQAPGRRRTARPG
jgi:Arc/MetJ family transcription regulator